MSYHLVTREEITGITIYTRVEQIRSASIIPIRIRNIGERNNKRYYEIIVKTKRGLVYARRKYNYTRCYKCQKTQ